MTQSETILFEKGGVQITDRQVVFGEHAVLIKEITVVDLQRIGPKPTGGIALLMVILLVILQNFAESELVGAYVRVAVLVLAGGLVALALMMTRESFEVWVITEERVAKVFTSRKEASAREIAEAVKIAMARHHGSKGKRRSGRIES